LATIRPFRALRPKADIAHRIAALPYDVYDRQEALAEVEKEPLSFLKIDRAETAFPEDVCPYDPRVYEHAKSCLCQMRDQGLFIREATACYYLY